MNEIRTGRRRITTPPRPRTRTMTIASVLLASATRGTTATASAAFASRTTGRIFGAGSRCDSVGTGRRGRSFVSCLGAPPATRSPSGTRTAWSETPIVPLRRLSMSHSSDDTSDGGGGGRGYEEDTIYALSTGGGGQATAVAVIRISGPHAHQALRILLSRRDGADSLNAVNLPKPRYASLRKLYDPTPPPPNTPSPPNRKRDPLDSALVLLFSSPSSFTGLDSVELHVHGSLAVVRATLCALSTLSSPPHDLPNVRPADRGEFTQSAYANGKLGLLEVEALADLIVADTSRQRLQALRQMDGRLSRLYEGWRSELIEGLAHAEAVIDFGDDEDLDPDEDPSLADGTEGEMAIWGAIPPRIADLRARMERHLRTERGELLRDGMKIAIVGPPNAGKSSLLNVLAQRDAAIVSPVAGTTRDVVEVVMDLGGVRCTISDTAGVREEGEDGVDEVEREGIKRAVGVAGESHVLVCVVDATDVGRGEREVRGVLEGIGGGRGRTVLFLYNKVDLAGVGGRNVGDGGLGGGFLAELEAEEYDVSCQTNDGIDDFVQALTQRVCDKVTVSTDDDDDDDRTDAVADEGAVITRTRHRRHVEATLRALRRFETLSGQGYLALDTAAEELRLAGSELGRVTGAVDVEDVLDVLFADFCIGK